MLTSRTLLLAEQTPCTEAEAEDFSQCQRLNQSRGPLSFPVTRAKLAGTQRLTSRRISRVLAPDRVVQSVGYIAVPDQPPKLLDSVGPSIPVRLIERLLCRHVDACAPRAMLGGGAHCFNDW